MDCHKDVVFLLKRFEQLNFDGIEETQVNALAIDLDKFFKVEEVSSTLLKQQKSDSFLAVLRLFLKVILSGSPAAYKPLFKHFEVVLEVLRSKLPHFKKVSRWQKFEIDFLASQIPKLSDRISTDDSWVEIWCFLAHILVTDGGQTPPLNALLGVTESAFRKGKEHPPTFEQAWACWSALIDALRNSPSFIASRRLSLLLKPLNGCNVISKGRLSTWLHLIEVHLHSSEENLKKCVEPFLSVLYRNSKALSSQLPDESAGALTQLLSMLPVRQIYLEEMIKLFKPVIDSKLSESALKKISTAFREAVCSVQDDSVSFNYWKSLLDQCCQSDSILANQARFVFCQNLPFQRWFESVKIDTKTILELMRCVEFRENVLIPSIKTLTKTNDIESPGGKKKKSKTFTADWYSFCDLYVSWVDQQHLGEVYDPSSLSVSDKCDYHAMLALLLHPLQNCLWNQQVFNTWLVICQICHRRQILKPMLPPIFEVATNPTFDTQGSIDILHYICRLDNTLCSMSAAVLEKIAGKVDTIEVKTLNDLLYVVESTSSIPELQPALIKVLKNVNDLSTFFDDSQRIRIKVAKIQRKIEPLSNLVDAEQTNNKLQRTPFKAQSNFQHRLLKAEEKKKSKTSLGSSCLFNLDNDKIELDSRENYIDSGQNEPENVSKTTIDSSSPLQPKSTISSDVAVANTIKLAEDGDEAKKAMVAEKENLNIPASAEPLLTSSPVFQSSGHKMKITNAREIKVTDGLSPTIKTKPIAGQKSPSVSKVVSSKVSYFDDDASDCVIIPPKLKTTPLTEHQKEILNKRRTDIPALYQDLSQDTQLTADRPSTIADEDVKEESPASLIPATQSDNGSSNHEESTPEPKNRKSCNSAKRLDFNTPESMPERVPDSANTLKDKCDNFLTVDQSIVETTPVEEKATSSVCNTTVSKIELMNIDASIISGSPVLSNGPKLQENIVDSSMVESSIADGKNHEDQTENNAACTDSGKKKRKRKSEPNKFSPKLTRSRKNKIQPTTSESPEPQEEVVQSKKAKIDDNTVPSESDLSSSQKVSSGVSSLTNIGEGDKAPLDQNTNEKETPTASCTGNDSQICSSPTLEEVTTPTNHRKCKASEEVTDESKKLTSSKKKKKLFRLTPSNNKLQNWLIRHDRIPEKDNTPASNSTVANEYTSNQPKEESIPALLDEAEPLENSINMDSEDIVPGTQEIEGTTSVSPFVTCRSLVVKNKSGTTEDSKPEVNQKDPIKVPIGQESPSTVRTETDPGIDALVSELILPKNEDATLEKCIELKTESPGSDDIELIISSPSRRGKRAASLARGEGDINEELTIENYVDEWSPKRSRRSKVVPSMISNTRSAIMLRLAVASQDDKDAGQVVTPIRKRESIVPITYGENWPKGLTQDWIARTPGSPFMSPARSTLKKTPARDDELNSTPQGRSNDSYGSPLLSSVKKKRVTFFDPPVTTGLLTYEDGSGALHFADVTSTTVMSHPPLSISTPESTPSKMNTDAPVPTENRSPSVPDIDFDLVLKKLQQKLKLPQSFMETISRTAYRIQGLLFDCFNSSNMKETIGNFRVAEYKQLCELPYSFLLIVENAEKENLADVLGVKPERDSVLVQTDPPPVLADKQTHTFVPVSPVLCQTDELVMVSVGTSASPLTSSVCVSAAPSMMSIGSTACPVTADVSTQADQRLPSDDELRLIVERDGLAKTLQYFSHSLQLISQFAPK